MEKTLAAVALLLTRFVIAARIGLLANEPRSYGGAGDSRGLLMASAMPAAFVHKWGIAAALAAAAPPLGASETFPAQVYEVTTETGMPHLEENLRYTVTHEKSCMAHRRLDTAFPVLRHPALLGCSLKNETRHNDTLRYALVCTGGHGTTGEAIWHIDEHQIRGTLNVRLGGKNMTFYQRITALPRGACQQ